MFQQRRFAGGAEIRTPKRQWMWIANIIAILAAIFSYNLSAQVSTSDILGTVQDQTGAVVRNATVRLLSVETNQERTTQTTESGSYTFTLLPPGHYMLTITAHGFKEYVVDSTLAAGDRARIDAHLVVGETTEKVEVTSTTPALQTDSASLGAVVTPQAVQDLPLNGRNFVQLAQLAPGVNEGPPDSIASGQRPDDRRQTSSLSANGQPDLANNQMIDSVDNNDAIIGTIGARPSIEAIAEFRVYTSLYPAELGKTGGAVINLITKSGTTQFHGSLFEFLRNDKFDGNTYNFGGPAPVKPEYRQNQFGGSIGGPLFKRAFIFGDYEGLRYVQGQPQLVTVPTLFEEQNPGNFSDIGGPVLTGKLDPVGLNYFKLFPAPTSTATVNNYYSAPNKSQYSNAFDVRVDYTTPKGDAIFGRETYNHVTTNTPSALPTVNVAGLEVNPGGNFNS